MRKCDDVCVAPKMLVKAVLSVSSTGCNNERQSFVKLLYSAIDKVLTNMLRGRSVAIFLSALPVLSILLIKSFKVLHFHCLEGNSFIILSTPRPFLTHKSQHTHYCCIINIVNVFHIYIYYVSDDVT